MTAELSRRRSRRWIGFFVVLAVLGTTAMIVPLVYNLSIQLTPDQLTDARRRWREQGSPNYDLEYLVNTRQGEQKEERAYLVQVRGGRVILVVEGGDIVYLDPTMAVLTGPGVLAVSPEDPGRYGVPALFDQIEAGLRQDETAKANNFATAQFDPTDGHPYHYRRGSGRKERVEWNIKMTRFPAGNFVLPRRS